MNILLSEVEVRVLGALVEKESTTPDYYPLSLNALINACNQKSNRDPEMHLDEEVVRDALHSLNEKNLAAAAGGADSRVTKYEHRLQEVFNFTRPETAIICVLMLRGPQTPGELRGRSERMHPFGDLSEVQSTLQRLMKWEPPLVKILSRLPGTKESRYAHLLSGEQESWSREPVAAETATGNAADTERIARLENEVEGLKQRLLDLTNQLTEFRKQFE
ncbi:MAG TPA: YceH family protein [Terriglobia bacterium]|nr:YceH family protein [Terriglobia bacterium]